MSSNKSKVRSRTPPKRRKLPSNAAATAELANVWPEKLVGAKYVRLLDKQLRNLQEEDVHGNRRLFLDDVFVAYLLAFFNPTIRSLRTIEDLSQAQQAHELLSTGWLWRSLRRHGGRKLNR